MLVLENAINNFILTVAPDTPVSEIMIFIGQLGKQTCADGEQSLPYCRSQMTFAGEASPDENILPNDCVFIIENSQLLGILTLVDLVRLIASGINVAEVRVAEVMRPIITWEKNFDVDTTLSLMRQHSLRNLPIVDDGQLLGIVTPESIAVGLQTELSKTKEQLQLEMAQRCSLELTLKKTEDELERQVSATEELVKANKLLKQGICDRLTTEAQLLQTTSEFQEIFQAFPDIYFRLKSDGTIICCHTRETSDLYLPPEKLLGKRMQDVLQSDVAEQFQQAILQVHQTNALVAIEYSLLMPDGNKSFEARLLPTIQQQIIVIIRNITERQQAQEALQKAKAELEIRVEERTYELTNSNERLLQEIIERKRVEQALRVSEERYVRAINAGNVGIWEWNLQTNEIYIDPNFKVMLGYEKQETSNQFNYWMNLVHPDEFKSVELEIDAYLKCLIPKYEIELRMLHKHGSYIWFLSRATVLRDAKNEPCFLVGSNTDITARKQVENKLKASLKEKEVLLKEIHHRVKNNLQIISSLLRLQARYIKDKQALDIFQDSQNRVRAMALIHENLYQYNNLAKIQFSDYIQKLTNNLLRSYGVSRNIIIDLNINKVLLNIDTAITCGLIINELISNSLKHAFSDGINGKIKLDFLVFSQGKYSLSVSDNGVGILEDIELLRHQSLGLQLVWNLVEQLEGSIAYYVKSGTLFTITFAEQS